MSRIASVEFEPQLTRLTQHPSLRTPHVQVFEVIASHDQLSSAHLTEVLGKSRSAVNRSISLLTSLGLVTSTAEMVDGRMTVNYSSADPGYLERERAILERARREGVHPSQIVTRAVELFVTGATAA